MHHVKSAELVFIFFPLLLSLSATPLTSVTFKNQRIILPNCNRLDSHRTRLFVACTNPR
jgi:hypothetical protein